jgi:anti-sigma factor (TIGR02949 family)
MSCEHLNDRLTDLLEGTLPGDVCEEVNRHLAECADCTRLRQDLQDIAKLCREAAQPTTMPEELRSRIRGMLANSDPQRPSV